MKHDSQSAICSLVMHWRVWSGVSWATEAVRIAIAGDLDNQSNGSQIEIVNYDEFIPAITVSLHDYYGYVVPTNSTSFVQLLVPTNVQHNCMLEDLSGFIGGTIVKELSSGFAVFDMVDAFCAPGGVLYVSATFEEVAEDATIQLNFRSCVTGGECQR